MKLTSIESNNVLGARRVKVDLTTPITMFVGPNGQGKTSILEVVAMAMTAQPARVVNLKKNYAQMITDGATTGQAAVVADGKECWMMLPTGKGEHAQDHAALPLVLDMHRLAAMDPKERCTFLMGLTGQKATAADITARLTKRGCDAKKFERVIPMLRAGFDAAAQDAAGEATKLKGAWREVTGEAWGSQKGDTWAAAVPEFDQAKLDGLVGQSAKLDQDLTAANQELGALRERHSQMLAGAGKLTELKAKAEMIDRITKKLQFDEQELTKAQADLARCPGEKRVGLVHDLAAALNDTLFFVDENHEFLHKWQGALDAYEREHGEISTQSSDIDPERVPAIKASVHLLTNAVNNARRDLGEAQSAQTQLKALQEQAGADPVKESDLDAAKKKADGIKAARQDLTTQINTLNAAKRAADSAADKTAKAAQHHGDIMAWLAIAEALGPNGIPADLMACALGPINARLKQSAEDTSWPVVTIDAEMAITYGGRIYQLLSKSERWRASAMLAEAVSHLSGLKFVVLDEFDLLDLPGRSQALTWLETLAINNEVDTVLVAATLKSLPASLPESVRAHWIEGGYLPSQSTLKAAA